MQEKIMQTSGADSEHKHSEVKRFSTLNKQRSHKALSTSVVNKFSDLH